MVQAYIDADALHLFVTFAAPTPPTGQKLSLWVTRFQASTEEVICFVTLSPPALTTWQLAIARPDAGNLDIAVYAALGSPATDRWPDTGSQRITAQSRGFYDNAVGGVVLPTNMYAILAPYLAMIGLVATAAVAVKKRIN